MPEIRDTLRSFLSEDALPPEDSLVSLCDGAVAVLEGENPYYRPKDKNLRSGGLLEFFANDFAGLPVVVVPDLHARGDFLLNIMDFRLPGGEHTVLELLGQGKVIVCCVGDIFHAEGRAKARWLAAYEEFCNDNFSGEAMTAEMRENLSLLRMVMLLKTSFPPFFHVLKGNHENVTNSSADGNRPFRKFCDEGNMVCTFLQERYDDLMVHYISCFEKALPLVAAFRNCVVSHAEPARAYARDEIINYHDLPDVTFGLTWTPNDDTARSTSAAKTAKSLLGRKMHKHLVWLAGHRPVQGTYALRQGGTFVQIHNPSEQNVALVHPDRPFDPDTDFFAVAPREPPDGAGGVHA